LPLGRDVDAQQVCHVFLELVEWVVVLLGEVDVDDFLEFEGGAQAEAYRRAAV
jgi:hypothetical protein